VWWLATIRQYEAQKAPIVQPLWRIVIRLTNERTVAGSRWPAATDRPCRAGGRARPGGRVDVDEVLARGLLIGRVAAIGDLRRAAEPGGLVPRSGSMPGSVLSIRRAFAGLRPAAAVASAGVQLGQRAHVDVALAGQPAVGLLARQPQHVRRVRASQISTIFTVSGPEHAVSRRGSRRKRRGCLEPEAAAGAQPPTLSR
jgi:hypothetical protein